MKISEMKEQFRQIERQAFKLKHLNAREALNAREEKVRKSYAWDVQHSLFAMAAMSDAQKWNTRREPEVQAYLEGLLECSTLFQAYEEIPDYDRIEQNALLDQICASANGVANILNRIGDATAGCG